MTEFLNSLLQFPTALFTVPLTLVLLYWLSVLLGVLDLDVLDPDGLAESLEAADFGDAGDAGDAGGSDEIELGTFARLLNALGLAGVPVTVSGSVFFLVGWVTCLLIVSGLGGAVGAVAATAATVGGLVAGWLSARVATRVLKPVFRTHLARRRRSFVDSLCTVATQRVDTEFGQVEIADGGAGLLVEARCTEPNQLTRGSEALVYDYRADDEVFLIAPLKEDFQATAAQSRRS